jgi:hypothetical protein
MRYGFTDDGFVVVDDDNGIGEFAYYSSPYWNRACRNPEKTAQEMLSKTWKEAPAHIKDEHYRLSCEGLNSATRWPKKL